MSKAWPGHSTDIVSWYLIGGMAGTCLIACRGLGFHIRPAGAILPGIGIAILCAAVAFGRARRRPRLALGATAFLQMTLFTMVGVMLSYALAARAGPLWDGALGAADRRLGFDWPAVFHAADLSPATVWVGHVAYQSLTVQMVTCIMVLSLAGRADTLRLAVAAAIASGFATVAISGLVPAMGNLFDPRHYHILRPSIAWTERGMLAGLRDGSWRTLDPSRLVGIVSFPSYHATLPIILAWAQRDIPRWRVVPPIWAGTTILATPLFGGHYGVDVLAGIALAPLALALAPRLVVRRLPGGDGASAAPPASSARQRRTAPDRPRGVRRPAGMGLGVRDGVV